MKYELPAWEECEAACDETPTPLQRFIYEYEPCEDTELWRERLLRLVEDQRKRGKEE